MVPPPAPGAPLLQLDDVTVVRGDRAVLDHMSLGVAAGDRIGVVGRNGAGKSTLLDALTGTAHVDSGRVVASAGTTVAVVAQHDRLPAGSVREAIVGTAQAHEWAADAGVRDVLGGLFGGVAAPLLDSATDTLSGGESRRVALASALVSDWDVLVLDEPTNHLDLAAIRWLAGYLLALPRRRAVVVVTHDRWFLDEVTALTWEVHDGVVDAYEGGYAAYVLAKAERERQSAVIGARRANLLRKELAWLRRGPPARTAKPKFRIDAANALIADEPPARDALRLRTVAAARLGKKVLDLTAVTLRPAPGVAPVVSRLTWGLGPGERVGILGPNGAGKTTLTRLVLGASGPDAPVVDAGQVDRGSTVRTGVLEQRLADVDADERVLPWLRDVGERVTVTTGEELTPSQLLEQFGFAAETAWKRLGDLSGGELRRLFLLRLLLRGPNLIVLDEPTNDLDIDTLTVLEDVLDSWPGTLVVVSHDRYFLERVCDDIYLMADGALRHLPGGVDQYLDLLAAGPGVAARRSPGPGPTADGPATGLGSVVAPVSAAESRVARKRMSAIERRLTAITTAEAKIHTAMVAAAMDADAMLGLTRDLEALAREHTDLESEWLNLAEAADD